MPEELLATSIIGISPNNPIPSRESVWRVFHAAASQWALELHLLRERALKSRTETWSRQDLEHLFSVGRATAQSLMKAIGEVQSVGGTHFIARASLLEFLDQMVKADSVEDAYREKLTGAEPTPRPKTLRVPLPENLRNVRLAELPDSIIWNLED